MDSLLYIYNKESEEDKRHYIKIRRSGILSAFVELVKFLVIYYLMIVGKR